MRLQGTPTLTEREASLRRQLDAIDRLVAERKSRVLPEIIEPEPEPLACQYHAPHFPNQ